MIEQGIGLKSQELVSALLHGSALLLSIAGLVILVVFASMSATPWHVVGFSIYGTSLILLYAASFVFHLVNVVHSFKPFLQKMDHIMIYVLIAGTYTPLCFTVLRGGWGWSLFGIIWALAIGGILAKVFALKFFRSWLSAFYYLAMGWAIMIAYVPVMKAIDASGFYWLLSGGVFYSGGVIFFALASRVKGFRYFGMHELFHVCVMLGSLSHFWLMYQYILPRR